MADRHIDQPGSDDLDDWPPGWYEEDSRAAVGGVETQSPPRDPRRALAPVAITVAGLAGLAYLRTHDPRRPQKLMPACLWHSATGLQCPACGGLRMTHDLVNGDLRGAARANPLLLAGAPFATWHFARWAIAGIAGREHRVVLSRRTVQGIAIATATWTVLRNVKERRPQKNAGNRT